MTRRIRAIAACFAFLALVFAQVAASAHLCALHQASDSKEVIAHGDHCGGSPKQEQPPAGDNVCVEHCQYGDASADDGAPGVPAAVVAGPFLRVEPLALAGNEAWVPAWRFAPAAAPPPPAILFGALRI